ncbi:MAG TPA: LysM peptidoglycan-binding domain-containing protein [Candidatus Saccharimonadales bacterium]|nr:LysM peptidoglycan-binding domain-containing protein [Candidatus Saccharimonadales bacterium]
MARRKKSSPKTQTIWEQSKSNIISGVLALALIIVGFAVFNTFASHTGEQAKPKEQTKTETKEETNSKKTLGTSDSSSSKNQSKTSKPSPKIHVVVRGESLSKISLAYYSDAAKWTVIAAENKLANPQIIHAGNKLVIPDLQNQTSSITTSPQQTKNSSSTVNTPKTYTVVRGDSLWTISQHFYNGNGYLWYKIRDANPGKVGLLPNGRPLITPGSVLTIPNS